MPRETAGDRFQLLWQEQERQPTEPPVDPVAGKAASFRRTIRRRNVREYAAVAIVVAVVGVRAALADTMLVRVACVATIAGALYVAFYLRRHGASEPAELAACTADHLEHHRRQLERQRDLLASVWRWYLGPLVPGLVLFAVSIPVEHVRFARRTSHAAVRLARIIAPDSPERTVLWIAAAIVLATGAAVFLGIARLNRLGARRLQREIDALLPSPLERGRS
ncbi:MAG TPA: hypothetical protein VKB80_29545 [Kofleriaceae bacterium]|nr:hypothetical protein [Kofleriaceae bacterium]